MTTNKKPKINKKDLMQKTYEAGYEQGQFDKVMDKAIFKMRAIVKEERARERQAILTELSKKKDKLMDEDNKDGENSIEILNLEYAIKTIEEMKL